MNSRILKAVLIGGVLLAGLSGCNPYVWGSAAALTVPQAVTGQNTFYNLDKYFGRRCSDSTYFDRPVRCVNDRS